VPGETPAGLGPQELIASLASRLLATLDRQNYAFRHDPERMLPLIDHLLSPHFDTEYTARLVLGQHWSGISVLQRQQFAAAFYQRLLRTYVSSVGEWTAKRFKLLPRRIDSEALQVSVPTEVHSASGTVVDVDYRVRRTPDGWKIFDVIVDGVSYVRSYHEDIDADVALNGIDATTARLEKHDTGARAGALEQGHRYR
jgi:phospholipid transport system substrate-binding protein